MIRVSVALLTSSQAGGQHSSLARFKVSGSNCFVSENLCHTRASTSCTVHVRSVADWQALIRLVSDVGKRMTRARHPQSAAAQEPTPHHTLLLSTPLDVQVFDLVSQM